MESPTRAAIVLYGSPTCGYCAALRTFLATRNVDYREIDVTTDAQAMRDLVRLTGHASVPTMMVGDTAVIGFDPDRVTELLFGSPDDDDDDDYEMDED